MAHELVTSLAEPLIVVGSVGVSLLDTVELFLRANGSTRAAAEALFVHRNTVSYRLSRVESLTGLGVRTTIERSIWTVTLIAMGRHDVCRKLEGAPAPPEQQYNRVSSARRAAN